MNRFAIISTQRSGSTLLRRSLDQHPDIRCAGEVFFPGYRKSLSYSKYVEQSVSRKILDKLWRWKSVDNYLNWLFSVDGYQAVGFKFMYAQSRWLPFKYPMVMRYLAECDARIIHMVRDNPLKIAVSRQVAKQTSVYHSRVSVGASSVVLDTDSLLGDLERIQNEKQEWRNRLKKYSVLEVSYESFVSDRSRESARILKFLQVDLKDLPYSGMVKVNPDSLASVLSNYREVTELLSGSKYESYIY